MIELSRRPGFSAFISAVNEPQIVLAALTRLRWLAVIGQLAATILAALLLQTVANFANDLFDFRSGADSEQRTGPRRGLQSGLITERQLTLALLGGIAAAMDAGPTTRMGSPPTCTR